jgi:hypothetical protein
LSDGCNRVRVADQNGRADVGVGQLLRCPNDAVVLAVREGDSSTLPSMLGASNKKQHKPSTTLDKTVQVLFIGVQVFDGPPRYT